MGEPDHTSEQQGQGAGQGHDPGIAEAQGSGWVSRLAIGGWLRDPRKGWARKDTPLTGSFSVQQAAVGCTCSCLQLVEVDQAALQPRSSGELQTVSTRSARPSFRYCLIRE